MKKRFLLIIALCSIQVGLQSQQRSLDSLLQEAEIHSAKDSQQVERLRRIAVNYSNSNSAKAIDYFTKAMAIAPTTNSKAYMASLLYGRGHSFFDAGNLNDALADYIDAAIIFEQTKDRVSLFEVYISIGNVYSDLLNYNKVNEYYNKAELYIDKRNDSVSLQTLYSQRGIIYDKRQLFDSALLNYNQALAITNITTDQWGYMNLLSNIGLTYKHKGDLNKALFYYDSAIHVYNTMPDPSFFAGGALYNNLASAYSKAGRIKAALAAFNTSLAYSKNAGGESIEMENYLNMADMYGSIQDYKNQAFYLQKHYQLKDSLLSADKKTQIVALESDYQIAQKNAEILKKNLEVNGANASRNTMGIVVISVVLLAIALFYILTKTKRTNELLAKQNKAIDRQRSELEQLNSVKDRLFSIVSHDLRNPLATLQTYLMLSDAPHITNDKKLALKAQTKNLVQQTADMLDNLLNWAHAQIKGSAITIKQVDLHLVIEGCVDLALPQAQQKNISIHYYNTDTYLTLANEQALHVIVRNLLTNAVKFTHNNGQITIMIQQRAAHTLLAIKDTGTGMDAATIQRLLQRQAGNSQSGTHNEQGSGLGMMLVQDLVTKMNGKLEIESELGEGSTFYVFLDKL